LQVGKLKAEVGIPDAVLRSSKGLAIFTVLKAGTVVTYKIGTGLVLARRVDGSWSPPSAIISCGIGWGPQVIIVRKMKRILRNPYGCCFKG
jgi:lipid-binding SYLF domain-containing protein